MSNFDSDIRNIRRIYALISGKDCDVYITFKGNELGKVKCWNVKVDAREANSETYEDAASALLGTLKTELTSKISMLETQANQLRHALGDFKN